MVFANMERHVIKFISLTYVRKIKNAKKDIVIRDNLSDATSLTDTTDANWEIFVLTFMKKHHIKVMLLQKEFQLFVCSLK